MDSRSKSIAAIAVFGLLLTGCGGGGGGDDGGPTGGGTQIQSVEEGAAAAGSGTSGATAGATISDIASNLGNLTNTALMGKPTFSKPANPLVSRSPRYSKMVAMTQKMVNSPSMQKAMANAKAALSSKTALTDLDTTDEPCTEGGAFSSTGHSDPITGDFNMEITYLDCREGDFQYNGTSSMSGTYDVTSDFDITFDDFTTQVYEAGALIGVMTFDVTFHETYSFSASDLEFNLNASTTVGFDYIFDGDGTITFDEFVSSVSIGLDEYNDSGSFSFDDSGTPEDPSDDTATFTDDLHGKITESWTDTEGSHLVEIEFDHFTTQADASGLFASPTAQTHDPSGNFDVSFSGRIKTRFVPEEDCDIEGTFNFETFDPLHFGLEDSCPVSGHVDINGNTHVHFNSNGSVDVSVGDDDVTDAEDKHYSSCEELEGLCEMEDFEPAGESSGGSGTGASGDNLLVTLTWDTPTSDMDLHVGYYSSSSPTTGPADALATWHQLVDTFGTANAELDFDDTEGYGPEHVTVDGLPAGYYVIAVNSYDLDFDSSATVNVSVTISGTVYTFPNHTFTTADFDGTDPNSWYRVTDLQCTSAGNCTFVAPNTALQVHDTAFEFKPRLKK